MKNPSRPFTPAGLALFLAGFAYLSLAPLRAADHGDGPAVAGDQACDIADTFAFLDPNDNTQAVLILDVRGFIVPSEAINFTVFDPNVKFTFYIENTGDAVPDEEIVVRFTPKTSPSVPQTATITLPNGANFTAPTTVTTVNSTPPTPVITTDPASGVMFFAGEMDDPFFFDIPAFDRFVASVLAGSPDTSVFSRGRDSFAGYNVLSIALRVPVKMLVGPAGSVIGVSTSTSRQMLSLDNAGPAPYRQVDRMGNPAVNVALVPFGLKDAYNASTPVDDANGVFANAIVGTLKALGTDSTHIGILAGVAVTHGDYLRLDTSIANSGPSGGNNPGAGFPNGRRLADDTITTLLTIINNGSALSDNVPANDVPLNNTFPFLAAPHMPLAAGAVDDTEN